MRAILRAILARRRPSAVRRSSPRSRLPAPPSTACLSLAALVNCPLGQPTPSDEPAVSESTCILRKLCTSSLSERSTNDRFTARGLGRRGFFTALAREPPNSVSLEPLTVVASSSLHWLVSLPGGAHSSSSERLRRQRARGLARGLRADLILPPCGCAALMLEPRCNSSAASFPWLNLPKAELPGEGAVIYQSDTR